MKAASRKDGHLARSEGGLDSAGAVLSDHVCLGLTRHSDNEVGGTRVVVRRQHGAGAKVEDGQGHSISSNLKSLSVN